jgi:D-3-phosphoglycerate dehydrogenase / 2-oxoglutarate reductase
MPRIVVTDATFPSLKHERLVAQRYGAILEEAHCKNEADAIAAATGTDVLIVQFAKITPKVIAALNPNATIVRYGIGLDNIDLKYARERNIKVTYVPDYATAEVADHTAALILAALRKIITLNQSVRSGVWDAVGMAQPVKSFLESTAGFLGFGRIGREVHLRLQAFGFKSIVFDPYANAATLSELNARSVDLTTLFSESDVLTLHSPLNSQTHHIVTSRRLGQMKANAIIVNTARGGLIDPDALFEALSCGRIAGAALDVFEQEPIPPDSKLFQLPNIILTPHAAWYSTRAIETLQSLVADEVDRHLSGREPRCLAPAA